ncbi:MAG: hypothetical protein NTZ49_04530 [Candidatus Parcubacteria bacterium]|nr:hypothetical protein [Candidatus Parcubacteria bacterium]
MIFSNPGSHFTWPDETANYFFIKNFVSQSNFSFAEPINLNVDNIIKPRSFNVYQGNLVPGSFLGMLLLYGLIGKIIGIGLVGFVTSLLAVIGVIFFYKLLLKIFEPKIAFFSALLMFIFPGWWYYANFSFLPNTAFIAFLLVGFYLIVSLNQNIKINYLRIAVGLLFIALALAIRTNEFIWILGILLLLALVYRKNIKWQFGLIFCAICILVFLPIFYFNQQTYGYFLSFGYLRLQNGPTLASALPTEFKATSSEFINLTKFLILPFGLHPRAILANFNTYVLQLFPLYFVGALLGILIFFKKYQAQKQAVYFLVFFLVSIYLLAYYGSWIFEDVMTLQLNHLGISYVRYFLPIYILALPFAAIFYYWLIGLFDGKKLKIAAGIFVFISLFAFSLNLVYFSGEDNLIKIAGNLKDYQAISQKVLALTEDQAIIISQRSDKVFFPERKVIGRWQEDDYDRWANIIENKVPLYYYSYEGEDFLNKFNLLLNQYGLELRDKKEITAKESLYKIEFVDYEENDNQ